MIATPLAEAAPITAQLWIIYAFGGLVIVYFFFMRQRQQKDPLSRPGGPRASLARQRDVERQMESLLVELSQMARQITAQLDTRTAKLEALIKEADDKITRLCGGATAAPGVSERPIPATPAEAGRDVAPRNADDPRHAAVYDLADAGLSAGQIAQRLSRPSGEVELILALRPGK